MSLWQREEVQALLFTVKFYRERGGSESPMGECQGVRTRPDVIALFGNIKKPNRVAKEREEGKCAIALPDVIHLFFANQKKKVEPRERLVGVTGFEPATYTSRT